MFHLQTLGSSSALPIPGRGVSSQVVTYNDKHYLIDCGEGTQTQMMRFKTKTIHQSVDAIHVAMKKTNATRAHATQKRNEMSIID